jgi:hypothetical protein
MNRSKKTATGSTDVLFDVVVLLGLVLYHELL